MSLQRLLHVVAPLADEEQERRRGGLLRDLERVQPAVGGRSVVGLPLLLRAEVVQAVLHVGEVGQLVVEVAVKQLDPQHQLALLVARDQVVEELQGRDE
jgi:hypothetical protein